MSKHSVWDREDVHPAWMINDLLRAESVECTFQFPGYGTCGAKPGERCRKDNATYLAPSGRMMRETPAHLTRYAAADAATASEPSRPDMEPTQGDDMRNDVRKQTYPNHLGLGAIEVVSDPGDEDLRIDVSVAEEDFIYLTRSQVRCLMHQLTDWLT